MKRADRLVGVVFIAVGVVLFIILQQGVGAEAVVAMIGTVFLVAYAISRNYGFLVPGGVLTGLGTGIILQEQGVGDAVVVLGLGAGFLAIAVTDLLVRGPRPGGLWPFIPGGILAIVGLSGFEGARWMVRWWPLALLAAGGWLILGHRRFQQAPPSGRAQSPPTTIDPPNDVVVPAPPEAVSRWETHRHDAEALATPPRQPHEHARGARIEVRAPRS